MIEMMQILQEPTEKDRETSIIIIFLLNTIRVHK
jgi:hypothetical protein